MNPYRRSYCPHLFKIWTGIRPEKGGKGCRRWAHFARTGRARSRQSKCQVSWRVRHVGLLHKRPKNPYLGRPRHLRSFVAALGGFRETCHNDQLVGISRRLVGHFPSLGCLVLRHPASAGFRSGLQITQQDFLPQLRREGVRTAGLYGPCSATACHHSAGHRAGAVMSRLINSREGRRLQSRL